MKRPTGVTIIAVLAIIGAVLGMLVALPFLGVETFAMLTGPSGVLGASMAVGLSIGVVWLVSAIVQLVFGIGSLQLKSWAWTLGIVLYGLTLAMYLVSLTVTGITAAAVVGILVSAVVIGYLYTHDVREAFGHLPHSSVTSGTGMVQH